ncbi:MAG: YihY/virulence factor BrkB family protein [Caldilineaceae bacterium]|nr:YihY/virulence factor BrkB family protein [Caldilineaceae bacterium]
MNGTTWWQLLKETVSEWLNDDASRLAAALAFYTALSVAPLLVMVIVVAGFVWGQNAVQSQLMTQLQSAIGPQGADFIATVLNNADQPTAGSIAGLISLGVLLWGSTNVFAQLQSSLNRIWNVEPKPGRGVWGTIRDRILSFGMVLGIAFLLLVSLILNAVLSALSNTSSGLLPGIGWVWQIANFVISFAVITLLFAAIYKVLPDVTIGWRSVLGGAIATALLFTIGKLLLGLYLANATSAYGAAGSVMAFLLWVYYSAQILFFGAEFTQVYARHFGMGVRPADNAQFIHSSSPQEAT